MQNQYCFPSDSTDLVYNKTSMQLSAIASVRFIMILTPFPRLHKPYNVCFLSHRIHKNKYRLRVRVLMCRLKQEIRSDFLSEAISNVRARFLRSFRKSKVMIMMIRIIFRRDPVKTFHKNLFSTHGRLSFTVIPVVVCSVIT